MSTKTFFKVFGWATQHDMTMAQIIQALCTDNWSNPAPGAIMINYKKKKDVTITNDVIMLGHWVAVHRALQQRMRLRLHASVFGSKQVIIVARSTMYWKWQRVSSVRSAFPIGPIQLHP